MDHPDFRGGGKIFATLGYPEDGFGNGQTHADRTRDVCKAQPTVFKPCNGVVGTARGHERKPQSARKLVTAVRFWPPGADRSEAVATHGESRGIAFLRLQKTITGRDSGGTKVVRAVVDDQLAEVLGAVLDGGESRYRNVDHIFPVSHPNGVVLSKPASPCCLITAAPSATACSIKLHDVGFRLVNVTRGVVRVLAKVGTNIRSETLWIRIEVDGSDV